MLVDSLVLSRMDYTLPVWGYSIISTFNPMSATSPKLGCPHHHVTSQMIMYHSIALLLVGYPLPHQVKYRSLCAMYHQYSISLDPTILFGPQHTELAVLLNLPTYQGVHCFSHRSSFVIAAHRCGYHPT